jgi:hypothetical protein
MKYSGFLLAFISSVLCGTPAQAAAPPSLFFSVEEAQQIDRLSHQTAPEKVLADITLDAIFYYGPADWTLWLQNRRWTPATEDDGIRVLSVGPGAVRLRVDEAGLARDITLKPHQTWQASTGNVVENAAQ